MTEQVMIYVISKSANQNALELFSIDSNYFYWNDQKILKILILGIMYLL
jgi:hypothetical protein